MARVALETDLGRIELEVHTEPAPRSARAFLAFVDDGSFTRFGRFYRTVRKHQNDNGSPTIDVVEGGWQDPPQPLPGIEHESTRLTGVRHLDGVVSLGRRALGTATGAQFFICIGDQPALDAGGSRHSDGQGFAAFGRVTAGMDVVRRIHQLPTSSVAGHPYVRGQLLDPPIRISSAHLYEET